MNANVRPARATRTDAALLTLIASGALGALGEIYDRHHVDVRRVLARLTADPADVDDLLQATFLELPKVAASFDGRDSARSWIFGIAARLAARRRRSLFRWVRALDALVHVAPNRAASDPEASTREREELRIFERALKELSSDKRSVFVLVELEGLAPADVAQSLGIPAATVRTRLFHARAELRTAMKGTRS